jgi:hypothetical protein
VGFRSADAAWAALGSGLLLGLYLGLSFGAGDGLPLLRHSSGILDMDVARVVADVTSARPAYRASVHPLQKLLLAPVGALLEGAVFRDGGLGAARLLIALATVLSALSCAILTGWLCRGARMPALAAGALAGVSFSSILAGSIPESAAFAALPAVLPLLLLAWRWERDFGAGELAAWAVLGVLGLGLTLTQAVHWLIALGARLWLSPGLRGRKGRGLRAAASAVLAAGLLVAAVQVQARLYPGTPAFWRTDPISGESPWLRLGALRDTPVLHGGRLLAHFLVLDFAAPVPVPSDFLIRSGFDYWALSIEEADPRAWPAARIALGLLVLAATGWGLWHVPRRDPRFLAPGLCVASQLALHLCYGREYVIYSPHWHGILVAVLVAGAWHGLGSRRRWLPAAAAGLAALLLANNLLVMRALHREIRFGLGAAHRDDAGRLRMRRLSPRSEPAPPRSPNPPGSSADRR